MILLIDSREQNPVLWDKVGDSAFPGLDFEFTALKTGDYSIKGMETPDQPHSICIERKSLSDLFLSLGRGRGRFERELQRMSEFDHAELVIEADWKTIFLSPPPLSQMLPKSVYRSVLAFSQRHKINPWPCPNRSFAERHIWLTLNRFWLDRQPNGKMEFSKI